MSSLKLALVGLSCASLLSACAVREAPSFPAKSYSEMQPGYADAELKPRSKWAERTSQNGRYIQQVDYNRANSDQRGPHILNPHSHRQSDYQTRQHYAQTQNRQVSTRPVSERATSQTQAQSSQMERNTYGASAYTQPKRVQYNPNSYRPTRYEGLKTEPQFIRTRSGHSVEVFTHSVKQGDTTYSLAKRFCSSVDDIRNLNALTGDYRIKIGQSLIIPRTQC
jgi:LysM repeat protein